MPNRNLDKNWVGEVRDLIFSGWKYRIKKVGQVSYISLRKDNKEKGFGRTTKEKIDYIKSIEDEKGEKDNKTILFSEMRDKLRTGRSIIKLLVCKFHKEGFCDYWKWSTNSLLAAKLREYSDHGLIQIKDNPDYILIAPSPSYCGDCNVFEKIDDKSGVPNLGLYEKILDVTEKF